MDDAPLHHLAAAQFGPRAFLGGFRRYAGLRYAFNATSTSSSIFFASPNSIRLFSL
jgi:hypothetical protein